MAKARQLPGRGLRHAVGGHAYTPESGTLMDAMCLWEVMLDAYQRDRHNDSPMAKIWEDMGTWQMRQYCADMIPDLAIAWKLWEDVHTDLISFDWEFCPNFLGRVYWTTTIRENATFVQVNHDGERIGAELLAAEALKLENT